MGFNGYNNNRRGGYNNNRGGYNRGYDRGYDNGRRFMFDIGQKVVHRGSGTELIIINYGREQYECRKPDLTSAWFYEHELEAVEGEDDRRS